ncbi:MAG: hypothetical protein ACOVKC_00315 [Brevundimonas sp.]
MIDTLDVRKWRAWVGRLEEITVDESAAAGAQQAAQEVLDVVEAGWKGVAGACRSLDYSANTSDDAEALVGAIAWYFIQSNPSFRALVPVEAETPR